MRVLLIEDDEVIADRVQKGLGRHGFEVEVRYDGASGLEAARSGGHELLLLDLMLPEMDGWSVCRALREDGFGTPILMLTARDEVEDRVRGLDVGADDYLPKPFDFRELLARMRALLRRTGATRREPIHVGQVVIDVEARTVRRAGNSIHLSPREFDVLLVLAERRGRVVTRDDLVDLVWDGVEPQSNTVTYHIRALRKKLEPESLIHTVHGMGYRLESDR